VAMGAVALGTIAIAGVASVAANPTPAAPIGTSTATSTH
jgi:hypothetical protein